MREIVNLHIGQCGLQMGHKFWEMACTEHDIDPTGLFDGADAIALTRLPVFFAEGNAGRFVPRTILCDLEPGCLNGIRVSSWGSLYHPDCFIFGAHSANQNWAEGFYDEGAAVARFVMHRVRNLVEMTESLQGIQITHGLGGGTGSGTTSLILQLLKDEFSAPSTTTYSVFPDTKVSDVVVEPYNAVFCMNDLIQHADQCVAIENEAIYRISQQKIMLENPDYCELNVLISYLMCGLTASLRFPGQNNADLRKHAVNLVPFPRLHFYCGSVAPLFDSTDDFKVHTVASLTAQAFDHHSMMCQIEESSLYMSASIIYRGNIPLKDVEIETFRIQQQYAKSFVDWIPHNIKCSMVDVAPKHFPSAAALCGNNVGIKQVFEHITRKFDTMYMKRAFVHHYEKKGVTNEMFDRSVVNMKDLINDYKQWYSFGDDE